MNGRKKVAKMIRFNLLVAYMIIYFICVENGCKIRNIFWIELQPQGDFKEASICLTNMQIIKNFGCQKYQIFYWSGPQHS